MYSRIPSLGDFLSKLLKVLLIKLTKIRTFSFLAQPLNFSVIISKLLRKCELLPSIIDIFVYHIDFSKKLVKMELQEE